MPKKPIRPRVPRTRAGGTMTESDLRKELLETFRYDPDTGYIERIKSTRGKCDPTGVRIGSILSSGYRIMNWGGFKRYGMCPSQLEHRMIFLMYHGTIPEMIDHINGDKSDNRIENLRPTNKSLNGLNRHKKVGKDQDLPVGVYRSKRGCYEIKCQIGDKIYSTLRVNLEEAIRVRKAWEEEVNHVR